MQIADVDRGDSAILCESFPVWDAAPTKCVGAVATVTDGNCTTLRLKSFHLHPFVSLFVRNRSTSSYRTTWSFLHRRGKPGSFLVYLSDSRPISVLLVRKYLSGAKKTLQAIELFFFSRVVRVQVCRRYMADASSRGGAGAGAEAPFPPPPGPGLEFDLIPSHPRLP
jgi:hypothetical protein